MVSILQEGRKMKLNVSCSCPSFRSSRKNGMEQLLQCNTVLFFNCLDSERAEIAKMISPEKSDAMMYALTKLQRGYCIGRGEFIIAGKETKDPVRIRIVPPTYESSEADENPLSADE